MKNITVIICSSFLLFSCSSPKPQSPTSNLKSSNSSDPNEYYENGNIRIEKIIDGNKEHWIFKQEDGGCWEEKFFENGEEHKRIVYNSNCVKSAEYELKNGNRNGEWISYNENGTIREKGNYEDGIQKGTFEYYDKMGELNSKEYSYILDSIANPLFPIENNLEVFKTKLKSLEAYRESENIEVAGKRKYHFPEIYWKNSILFFDLIDGEQPVKCLAGKIKDDDIPLFGGIIIPGKSRFFDVKFLGLMPKNETNAYQLFDLKENIHYSFKIENEIITEVEFKTINRRH